MKNTWKVRAVDMCIYIDTHIYNEFDESLVFGYLQWLFYALSIKKRYFSNYDDYDSYAIYAATQTYIRLTDKRQFLPEDDPKYLKRVKSVLNFIKRIMYPLKVNYQKSVFNEVVKSAETSEYDGASALEAINDSLTSNMINSNSYLSAEIELYIKSIKRTIERIIANTPYRSDPTLSHRLYMSCLISFLKRITLSAKNKYRLKVLEKEPSQKLLDATYEEEQRTSTTCWRLSDEYDSYIHVLTTQVLETCVKDIKALVRDYSITDDILQVALLNGKTSKDEDE